MYGFYLNMDTPTDYYVILGVTPQAKSETIKAAFKKLALRYHPDIYKGEDADERMRTILQAYRTLSDPEKRRLYDAHQTRGGATERSPAAASTTRRSASAGEQDRFAFPNLQAELA